VRDAVDVKLVDIDGEIYILAREFRKAGLHPNVVVLVATVRALKSHGGVAVTKHRMENLAALNAGLINLERHLTDIRHQFGSVRFALRRRHHSLRLRHRGGTRMTRIRRRLTKHPKYCQRRV
jgi:Formate--tetrahydrofolate ligase